jgi:excisionase family DNA binding protein
MANRLLTTKEVSERLHLCPDSIRKLARSGVLPSIRLVRGRLRFSEVDIDRAVESRSSRPAPGRPPAA